METKIYPFSSPIIYEQKTQEQQNQYAENHSFIRKVIIDFSKLPIIPNIV